MRVVLFYNPTAGSEDHTETELVAAIASAGHQVVAKADSDAELSEVLKAHPADLLVAAGGDGTVDTAACALIDAGVPLAIFPLGTANNLARCHGISGSVEEIAKSWSNGVFKPLDVAQMKTSGHRERFVEAFGFGAFPELMQRVNALSSPATREAALARDLTLFRSSVENATARRYSLSLDGEARSGDYLCVEVLNIPWIGPNVPLGGRCASGDGQLTAILVGEQERDTLLSLLDAAGEGRATHSSLPTLTARELEISSVPQLYHLDGELHPQDGNPGPATHFTVTLQPGAVRILTPRP